MNVTAISTGKPSLDRPWMKFYPEAISQLTVPECTLSAYLEMNCVNKANVAIHYYGTDITWNEVFANIDATARALRAVGYSEGDQIPVFFRSVPEFISLLIAAERIGASLVSRDNLPEENAEAISKAGATVIFAHDFLTQEEIDEYQKVGVKKFVLLSPYHSADRTQIPDYIESEIQALYPDAVSYDAEVLSWDSFLELGKDYTGIVEAPVDINRPLYRAYTSGSTGPSKQVIHSAHTMIGVMQQMSFYGSSEEFRPTWLVTVLPPFLIAVVVSMLLLPLSSNKLLILDPFCSVNDLDLEMMRYRPNCWPLIPMFIEVIMNSKRIPADYDMSHLFAAGAGCESFNNGQVARAQKFISDHGCQATFTIGYGQSEAGSNATLPCPIYPVGHGNIGIPMPLTTISIFTPGTHEELSYNELGEICISGPGIMLGYDDPVKTAQTLKRHEDGNVWLHTGDIGYMDDKGVIFAFGRGNPTRYKGGYLSEISMENRIIDANIDGIVDEFFVVVSDKEHPGYYVPYLYVILEDGYTIEQIQDKIYNALNDYEKPVDIIQLPERPFFHFKTNRIGLANDMNLNMVAFANQD